MVDFDVAVAQWAEKAKGKLNQFSLEFCQDLYQEIIETTPVDKGNLRASWWPSLDTSEAYYFTPETRPPTPVFPTVSGHIYYLMNGAAYARRIEYGFVGEDSLGRVYNQQPRAMVRNAVARAPIIAEAVLARLK